MAVKIVDVCLGGGAPELIALEREIGNPLPRDYRDFVLKHGGGRPRSCFQRIPDFEERIAEVKTFLNLGGAGSASSIAYALDVKGWKLPKGFFPIAEDSGGSLYALQTSGDAPGGI